MGHCNCIVLVLLGVAFANGSPVWFYNTGVGNADPTGLGCSSFTSEYDPYTGYFTYRCIPDVMNSDHLFIPGTHVYPSPDNAYTEDKDSAEDDILAEESFSERSGGPHARATYQSFTSGRSGGSRKKNNRPRRPTSSRRNRCPAGQIFQSELNICIDHPSAPPLPPKRPSNMLNDGPKRPVSAALQRPTSSLNLCPAGQIFQSELNICIDHPSAPPLPPKRPIRPASAALQRPPASGTILAVGKFDIKNRCKPSDLYISELGICLPRNNCYPYGRTC